MKANQSKNPKKTPPPAPKPAKHTPSAAAVAARKIVIAVDEAGMRGPTPTPPFSLPPIPSPLVATVRALLYAARLPCAALPPTVARFAALLDEWERFAESREGAALVTEVDEELARREYSRDWRSYRDAQLARLARRVIADALRALRPLDPGTAQAVANEARARFDDLGKAVLDCRAEPLPALAATEDDAGGSHWRLIVARLDDALDALAECARNPPPVAGEPATPTAAAVRELGAKVEAAAAATREAVRAVGAPVSALVEERRNADADDAAVRETQKREAFEAWAHGFDFATPGGASARRASFVMFCGGKEGAAYRGVPRMLNAEEFERLCQNKMRNLRR